MKKTFVFLLTLLLVIVFSLSAFAKTEEIYIYEIDNVTIVFDENDTFDATTRQAVAQMLVNGKEEFATYNLLCTLFDHNYEQKGVTTITHCVHADQPRCLEEYFVVQVCSRCEDTIVTRTGFSYITCCPNDA